tara:strand:- start:125 stop:529 length:405 start_codon:yes stop_codon:yes gene_type:complete
MTSQLNVDTIKGKSTAGSITIQSEGSPTTNLQKGLAKVTASITLDGSANSASSLNVSSVADGGTGLNTLTVSNPFSNVKSAVPNMTNHDNSYNRGTAVDDTGTTDFILRMFQASGGSLSDDATDQAITIHGDLA